MASSTYGDGSDGALIVSSGTYYLNLNQKYQFSSIYIAPGATLSSNSTTGSVLYMLCSGTADIQGTIDVSNVVIAGNNTWGTTIDGTTYNSPGVQNGNNGLGIGGTASNGFGGGGSGAGASDTYNSTVYNQNGGNGGNGSATFGTSGALLNVVQSNGPGINQAAGNNGTGSAGGGGAAIAYYYLNSGNRVITVLALGGEGGNSYGANGANGSGYWGDVSGFGSVNYNWDGGGGGGAGGYAGKAGVHVVIKSPSLNISGTIVTKGTNGGNGGDGGKRNTSTGNFAQGGSGGGAGGGGNAGNLTLTYTSITGSRTLVATGGAAGTNGGTYTGDTYSGGIAGTSGTAGTTTIRRSDILTTAGVPVTTASLNYEREYYQITTFGTPQSRAYSLTVYQSLPQKDYEYRIFNKAGTFIGTWQNVTNDPSWSQALNQSPSELNVQIARSPDNKSVSQSILQDSGGVNITDTNGDVIYTAAEASNAVGAGTDVDINLYVELYVFYGGYENLLDTNSDVITDTSGEPITVQYGSPNGKRVYAGYIGNYELVYGENQGVNVTVIPHSVEQNHYVFKTVGGNTTVPYTSVDPVTMARDAMNRSIAEGSIITYDAVSMPLTGLTASYEFNLQTTKETVDKAVDLLPYGYYAYVDPGELKQYLLNRSATAQHTFYYENHITNLVLKRSITQLINKVYFVGGDIGGGVDLFKYYDDTTSISTYRPGLERLSDGRVTLSTSALALSQSKINEFKDPRYQTTVVITDAVYDIETIKLGDMVAFKNFGSFADSLLIQIVNLRREKHKVILDLDMLVPSDNKRLEEIKRRLNTEDVADIPVVPA